MGGKEVEIADEEAWRGAPLLIFGAMFSAGGKRSLAPAAPRKTRGRWVQAAEDVQGGPVDSSMVQRGLIGHKTERADG